MTKGAITLNCCGRTVNNTRLGRFRHRQEMKKEGVDCPLPKRKGGPPRQYTTPVKKAKDVLRVQKWRASQKETASRNAETVFRSADTDLSNETDHRNDDAAVADCDKLPVDAPRGTICRGKKRHKYDWYDLGVESDTTYGDPVTLSYE